MNTENLKTLKIHKLSEQQYEREKEKGTLDPTAIYLTPDDGDADSLTVDLDGTVAGEPNTINADTLGGKPEALLSVLTAENASHAITADTADYATNADTLGGKSEEMLNVADSAKLGGRPASDYATETFVANKIAEAQLGGGEGTDIDLTGFATKDDVAGITLESLGAAAANNVVTLTTATALAEKTNLNDIKAPGVYKCTSSSVLPTLENCPTKKFFKMYVGDPVAITTNDRYISQEIIESYSGTRYYRYSLDGSWVSWKTTYDSNNITDARQTLCNLGKNPVASDSDTPAAWAALGTGHAYVSVIENEVVVENEDGTTETKTEYELRYPGQPAYYGIIENIVCGDLVKQIWHTQSTTGRMYERAGRSDGSWYSDWKRVAFTSEIQDLASSTACSMDLGVETHLDNYNKFTAKMNSAAKALGMTNTIFKTSSGLPTKPVYANSHVITTTYNNYITALDTLRLFIAAKHTPSVLEIMGTKSYQSTINGLRRGIGHIVIGNDNTTNTTWANENNYNIIAAKGGSLKGSVGEIGNDGILNMGWIIQHTFRDETDTDQTKQYAVAVLGLKHNDDSEEKKLVRTLTHDLIEMLKGNPESAKIAEVTSESNREYPVCMAAVELTDDGTFEDDIARLEDPTKCIAYGGDTRRVAASISKVMTALICAHNFDNTYCTITLNDLADQKNNGYIDWSAGDLISIKDAMYIMLLHSDNEMATMIAREIGSKDKYTLGKNPVSKDTCAAWAALGNGTAYIDSTSSIVYHPTALSGKTPEWGIITNRVHKDIVSQEWHSMTDDGIVYHRAGSWQLGYWYKQDTQGNGIWTQTLDANTKPEHIGAASVDFVTEQLDLLRQEILGGEW